MLFFTICVNFGESINLKIYLKIENKNKIINQPGKLKTTQNGSKKPLPGWKNLQITGKDNKPLTSGWVGMIKKATTCIE